MNRLRFLPAAKGVLDQLSTELRTDVLLRMDAIAELVRLAQAGQSSGAGLGLGLPGALHTEVGHLRVSYQIDPAAGAVVILSLEATRPAP